MGRPRKEPTLRVPETQIKIGTKYEMQHAPNKGLARAKAIQNIQRYPTYYKWIPAAYHQMNRDRKQRIKRLIRKQQNREDNNNYNPLNMGGLF